MACAQIIGKDTAVTTAGAADNFELNVMMPVIAKSVLESIRLLSATSALLTSRCIDQITANTDPMLRYTESSPSVVAALNRYLGYENAAVVARQALSN
jgi:fumarate hydratase, class II